MGDGINKDVADEISDWELDVKSEIPRMITKAVGTLLQRNKNELVHCFKSWKQIICYDYMKLLEN